jgi:hypothetical protein
MQQSALLRARYWQGAETANNGKGGVPQTFILKTLVWSSNFSSVSCAENAGTAQVIKFTALLKLEILLCINANDPARDLTMQQSIVLRARYKQGAESANNGKDQECPKEPLFSNTVVGKSDFASASCAENVETF